MPPNHIKISLWARTLLGILHGFTLDAYSAWWSLADLLIEMCILPQARLKIVRHVFVQTINLFELLSFANPFTQLWNVPLYVNVHMYLNARLALLGRICFLLTSSLFSNSACTASRRVEIYSGFRYRCVSCEYSDEAWRETPRPWPQLSCQLVIRFGQAFHHPTSSPDLASASLTLTESPGWTATKVFSSTVLRWGFVIMALTVAFLYS